ncbi:hypothetical protein MATL_G00041820 [Megalops atlanticus]|uniref:Bcr-Abl oncoprotein oligomerisation domain-containing protein n=1 Tax=Megalops atlanticus TaxID=7932 RepID=A0A9D3TGP8_MEGAT|nr:hypothetical protein MATL_G00041820 [Megalops atlanticus]
MDLNSVEDIEKELEKCKTNLKKLQQALSEEKFKVIYLQTTIARQKKSYDKERWDSRKGEKFNADTVFTKAETDKKAELVTRQTEGESLKVPMRKKLNTLTSKGSEDHGDAISGKSRDSTRSSQAGRPLPVPPRKKPTFTKVRDAAGSGSTQPDGNCISRTETIDAGPDNKEASDHEYEDVELNENFVRGNLVTPKIVSTDSLGDTNPHRDALRQFRRSKDFDSSDDGRLSPAGVLYRSSRGSGCSTPDRRSDGYLSSDHEDSSSVGKEPSPAVHPCLPMVCLSPVPLIAPFHACFVGLI